MSSYARKIKREQERRQNKMKSNQVMVPKQIPQIQTSMAATVNPPLVVNMGPTVLSAPPTIDPKQMEFQKVYQQLITQNQGKIQELNASIPPEKLKNLQERLVINYIADRNGCGYFRAIFPFELLAVMKNVMTINSFLYHTDPSTLTKVHTLRFQRQATNAQLQAWDRYIMIRKQYGFNYKMQYEIDDLLMEIEDYNVVAKQFFDEEKKQNHLKMLRSSDSITFSTEALKKIYVEDYKIDGSKIKVVNNFLPQFLYSFPSRNSVKEFNSQNKMRVFWSGSASHVGAGGDLEFLEPLIRKTVDKFQFVFQGVFPPSLTDLVKEGKIEFHPWSHIYGLSNIQFYKCRPDVFLAPLKPSRFNSCKSDLKLLESSALGCPTITTSFRESGLKSPYEDNADICIEPNADHWESVLDHLSKNPDYYMEIVKNQYKFLNGRWMENNLDQWIQALL